jgi:hypothetical protein
MKWIGLTLTVLALTALSAGETFSMLSVPG